MKLSFGWLTDLILDGNEAICCVSFLCRFVATAPTHNCKCVIDTMQRFIFSGSAEIGTCTDVFQEHVEPFFFCQNRFIVQTAVTGSEQCRSRYHTPRPLPSDCLLPFCWD